MSIEYQLTQSLKYGKIAIGEIMYSIIKNNVLVQFDPRDLKENGHYDIPDGVTTIGENCFQKCPNLKSITIPSSVKTIEEFAFFECNNLKCVIIPNGVTTIENSAFFACAGLERVLLPDTLTDIKNSAFSSCKKLSYINIPQSVKNIGKWAFFGTKLTEIHIPKTVENMHIGTSLGLCGETLQEISFEKGSPVLMKFLTDKTAYENFRRNFDAKIVVVDNQGKKEIKDIDTNKSFIEKLLFKIKKRKLQKKFEKSDTQQDEIFDKLLDMMTEKDNELAK